jgi:hypothetical protein
MTRQDVAESTGLIEQGAVLASVKDAARRLTTVACGHP